MTTRLNPYISFRDNAREALEFYHGVFGGNLDLSTFAEFHASEDPADADKIMHGQVEAPNGMTLMASDTPSSMDVADSSNITISLSGDDESELRGYWDKLSDGGTVTMPLEMAPWGDYFGQLTDRFGISWLVNIAGQRS
ncbi:VOC family protein [Georgenia sp. EYE_87]|uniref:VOC family protein n=1 Tax=Georgenia sp. EYE_87 TaxID=2853448 RepID=UPI0020063448|nr:VOC family protein [Georgenia sp. EYE_87]MCK6211448.1 VOC family protein [Georgenia sp. EYE_87]